MNMTNNFRLEITTESEQRIVTQPELETGEDRLNRLALECGYNSIDPSAIHITRLPEQQNGVTLTFNRHPDEAYVLQPAVAARISRYTSVRNNRVPDDYTGVVAINRIYVSYSALSRINTAVEMERTMGPLINEAIKDFIDEIGFIELGYKITAERSGLAGQYFTDLDNAAGMEFRLCLIKVN